MTPWQDETLREVAARYEALPMRPLRVTLHLGTALYAPDAPMLDAILAGMVVRDAYHSGMIPDVPADVSPLVPAPLKTLWTDDRGFPLFACTSLTPAGAEASDVYYHHKRHQPGKHTKRTKNGRPYGVNAQMGRFIDRQRALTTTVAERLTCTAIGNAQEIARLLKLLSAVGKERARGMGKILKSEIEEIDAFSFDQEGKLSRDLPFAALEPLGYREIAGNLTLGAWTPPYWRRDIHSLVVPRGTAL